MTTWTTRAFLCSLSPTLMILKASVGSQSPQPHLKSGSAYRQNRPTQLDKIKNLHAEVRSGHVILRRFRELPFHTVRLMLDPLPSTQPVERQVAKGVC